MNDPMWRKSTRSGAEGGHCVELADLTPHVAVRDSKNPDSTHLSFDRSAFRTFVQEIHTGRYDR